MKYIITFFFLFSFCFSQNLQDLLDDYKNNSDLSNKTIDESIGHLRVYTQDQLIKMQYHKLSDILKELRLLNLNNNRYSTKNLSNAGFKTSVSTSVKLFINNHEVSSIYTLSPFSMWDDLPLDFISHIEVYNGNSSFSLGSEPGANYIKIYTKSPYRLNASQLKTIVSNDKSRSFGFTQSTVLENNWAYLLYAGTQKNNDEKYYKNQTIYNNSLKKYLYLTLQKDSTQLDIGYAEVLKDNYLGYSVDSIPDDGELKDRDYYISYTNSYLNDKSLKTILSYDANERKYEESNSEGILFPNFPTYYSEDLEFEKYNAYLSKNFNYKNNNLLLAVNYTHKKKKLKNRVITTSTQTLSNTKLSNFENENIYSLMIEDKYKINDKLYLTANAKFDKYIRNETLEDSFEKLLRIGSIYLPTENLGFKFFLSQSYIPPTFYYVDFANANNKNLKSQKIKYASLESVYSKDNHKISLLLSRIIANDLISFASDGYYNVPVSVIANSYNINYDYTLNNSDIIQVNFYKTNSNQAQSNSSSGGYIKYMGGYKQFDYFTSLILKKGYIFDGYEIKDGYDFSVGTSYKINKNMTLSLKAENILNKSIKTLYADHTNITAPSYFTLRDYESKYSLSFKWLF